MALQAVSEVALHFGGFRNVDLFYQGIYQLRCRVFEETDDGTEVNAVPHAFLPEVPGRGAAEAVLPAAVLGDEAVFRTKSVLIRYCEERADLNDVVFFRVERAAGKDPPLKAEVQLLFAEAPSMHQAAAAAAFKAAVEGTSSLGTPTSPSGAVTPCSPLGDSPGRSPGRGHPRSPVGQACKPPGEKDFITVSSQRLRLNNVMQGIHAFCPLSFDEMHFCRVEFMAHSALLDFRLRIRPEAPLPQPGAPRRAGLSALADALVELGKLAAAGEEVQTNGRGATSAAAANPAASSGAESATDGLAAGPDAPQKQGTDASSGSGPAGGAAGVENIGLEEAVTNIQRECVARLVESHVDLATFLSDLSGEHLPLLQLPGNKTTEAGKWPGDLTPISSRLGDARQPMAAAMAVRLLVEDLNFVSAQVQQAWQRLLRAAAKEPQAAAGLLHDGWNEQLVRYWTEFVHCRTASAASLAAQLEEDVAGTRSREAAKLRESPALQHLRSYTIEDLAAVPPPQEQPLIFEQRYGPQEEGEAREKDGALRPAHAGDGPRPYDGVHVIVLVHGFQGTGFDMRLMKNIISLHYPAALCLCSIANEEDTEGNIEQMGEKLAAEVRTYIQDWCAGEPPEPSFARLSFVTHSVGGLIARAALPFLAEFHDRMHAFMSFSSPHLGYLYSPTSLFQAGLWVAKKLKKSKCLEQLSLTDAPVPGSCFLSRLSELPGLEHFQHVVLVSSHQDQYAPFESARIEMPRVAEADPKLGPHYAKMLRSLLDPVKAERLIRLDVDFHIPETNIDTVIGRTAHIQFIESQPLMRMLVQTHGFLFE